MLRPSSARVTTRSTLVALVLFLGAFANTGVAAATTSRVSRSRRGPTEPLPSGRSRLDGAVDTSYGTHNVRARVPQRTTTPNSRVPQPIATTPKPLVKNRAPQKANAARVPAPREPVSFNSRDGAALRFDEADAAGMVYDNANMRTAPVQARIINGQEVNPPGKFPWMVGIVGVRVFLGEETESFWCGGTVVSPEYVMSASHCYFSDAGSPNTNFDFFRVKVGAHNIDEPDLDIDVDEIFGHPRYVGATFENDVALLKLKTSLDSKKYPPVQLSWDSDDYLENTNTIVMGWGTNENGNLNTKLHQVSVPTVSKATCSQLGSYPGPPTGSMMITDTMLCAGLVQGGKDACQGDSGGPLIAIDSVTGDLRQTGIVSWGEGCALPNKYGVYANVLSLRAFIIRRVANIQLYSPLPPGVDVQGAEETITFAAPRP